MLEVVSRSRDRAKRTRSPLQHRLHRMASGFNRAKCCAEAKPSRRVRPASGQRTRSEKVKRIRRRAPARKCVGEIAAEELLAETRRDRSRKIRDEDVLRVLQGWRIKSNDRRLNVLPEGQKSVASQMLGITRIRAYHKHTIAAASKENPSITKLLVKYVRDQVIPDFHGQNSGRERRQPFPFTTICVNKEYGAKRHRDNNNWGPCVCRAIGDFRGGRLRYWPQDPGPSAQKDVEGLSCQDAVVLDHTSMFRMFHGGRAHEVLPFEGERYSLVYFTISSFQSIPDDLLREAQAKLGMPLVRIPTLQRAAALADAAHGCPSSALSPAAQPGPSVPRATRSSIRKRTAAKAALPPLQQRGGKEAAATMAVRRAAAKGDPEALETMAARLVPGGEPSPSPAELQAALVGAAARLRHFERVCRSIGDLALGGGLQ